MALTPNFDRIVATITTSDIEKFLHSNAPDDDKQRVLKASSNKIKMRLVGGYLIRTNQITPARLAASLGQSHTKPKAPKTAEPRQQRKSVNSEVGEAPKG